MEDMATGYVMEPICGGELTNDQMWSNFLSMLVLSLILFGGDGKHTEADKEDKKNGQQPVPAESNE